MGLTFRLGQLPTSLFTDASNNVGIGAAASGSYKLQVTGTTNLTGALSGTSATFSSTNTATAFIPTGSTVPTNGMYLSAANTLNFATNTTNRLTITSAGNVGIGSSPSSILQIGTGGGGATTRTTLQYSNGGYSATNLPSAPSSYSDGDKLIFWDDGSGKSSIGIGNAYNMIIQSTGASNAAIQFFTSTSGAGTERMRITSGGNVGIGITPLSKFFVNIASGQNIRFSQEGGQASISAVNDAANAFAMLNIDGNVVRIQSNNTGGNVCIGTATDFGYKLNLNGQPGCNGYTAWTNWSDSRLKENITDLETTNVLDKICAIRPVTYNYNELSGFDEATRSRRISGFIAQELMEVFPDMVGTITKGDEEYYDTNLSNLTLYLVKAIQEMNTKLDEQNQLITSLQDRLDKAGL